MTPYETPAALRDALEARLIERSRAEGIDYQRLRRLAVFERLLVRLEAAEPGQWILKGGFALEVRLGGRARTTRDLDLAVRDADADGARLRERLIDALSADPRGDGFRFEVGPATPISADLAGRPGWRFSIRCSLAGRSFGSVRVDVVARETDIAPTERVALPNVLSFAGFDAGTIDVVTPQQHFAEKLHAMTRTYAGERESTRVRDLADLVLLIEQGLERDGLLPVVEALFAARGTHPVPREIADPPPSWAPLYAELAAELDVLRRSLPDALDALRAFWSTVHSEGRR